MIRRLVARPTGVFAVVVLGLLVVLAAVSLVWTPQDPFRTDPFRQWSGPSAAHWFGTDASGRDIASYLLAGTRTTVLVAVGSGVIASVVGIVLTAVGSLTARWVREGTAVLLDILVAFPTLLTAMLLTAVFGGSLGVVVVSVGLSFGVTIARVARGEIRRIARSDYVVAARASGVGPLGVLTRHLVPNAAPLFTVQLSLAMATAVLAEAGLSYLGYGAGSDTASWGSMLADLQTYVGVHPWSAAWPGAAIALVVAALSLLGDAVRDATDPRLTTGDRASDPTTTSPTTPGVTA
ncbi:ABC transporter permease [Curtobacterium sp. C1]|uniref:ABC transporter permease n=1 Tax=Curtobacterium citreum TaxID=2036 RepID=A0A850DRJ5_9MICO|nr:MULTISPECIES: ABC transporter permease [Curtobacterium]KTR24930.1 peptide ABC transporter permease [Curtobacterium citreum]NUU27571.1 ABC transporter permease [Curtobacterium albidum]QKS16310.1 ABC transporter permease [Curtobacterium sp. Csp2]UFU12813.1 ABC transporter permease [Curtobacterium sp. C1]